MPVSIYLPIRTTNNEKVTCDSRKLPENLTNVPFVWGYFTLANMGLIPYLLR
jgi:hypothetical protein